jgi:ACS family tartrate transporter-like MFS transporter
LTDGPKQATWLREEERAWLEAELRAERMQVERLGTLGLAQTLADRRVLLLAVIWLLSQVPTFGVTFFLPQIVKGLGVSNTMTGLLTAIPYVIGAAGPLLWGYSSDRRLERRWHFLIALMLATFGLLGAGIWHGTYWALLAMSVATVGIYGSKPCMWSMPSQFLSGTGLAVGLALISSIGSLGGYLGPFVVGWIKDSTRSFELALYFLSACALSSVLLGYFAKHATAGPRSGVSC